MAEVDISLMTTVIVVQFRSLLDSEGFTRRYSSKAEDKATARDKLHLPLFLTYTLQSPCGHLSLRKINPVRVSLAGDTWVYQIYSITVADLR